MTEILLQCQRCHLPFLFPCGPNLTDYCSSCRLRVGERMSDARRAHMNGNYRFQIDALKMPTGGDSRLPRPLVFIGPRHRSTS